MKLSVVLAVFNEEDVLATCLESIKGLADEIIIVDGGSTDKTVEIAKKYGAKVFVTDNPPIFHINKQRAVDRAKGDWILQLDADEVVPEALSIEIRTVIPAIEPGSRQEKDWIPGQARNDNGFNGYYVSRKNYFLWYWMRKGGQYPDYVVRLFKRGKGSFPQKSVHEQIVVDGPIGYLKTPLEHRPYTSFAEYWQKAHTYAMLRAREMAGGKLEVTPETFVQYYFLRPTKTFLNLYVRHKGFVDGIFGFLFALFSAYQEPLAFRKYIQYGKNFN